MKRIHFFATKNDTLSVTDEVERKLELKYILTHHTVYQKYDDAPIYETARNIPEIGSAAGSQTTRCENYLVVERNVPVSPVTEFFGELLPEGGKWYTFYRAGNCPEGVEFNAGGMWSSTIMINGLVRTWSDDSAAQRLMRLFASAMKKQFQEKINGYWIGAEAYQFLKNGGRLTQSADAPSEFDLKLE
ncbi:hypothetical protein [Burkholderia territorii]|uniref:Uncharacterized protein n=1 Tax=Burkholderia territorii TaxID=1503055 RepID=A0A6L3NMJ1_9BURK|nr:hypothetical protein [Burkholderia territorii]KAB0685729.1 hypothetical protein F7R13_03405 [Burkholderia territorii]KWA28558.1 hypothetical protein WT39_12485 [Burkholderia territorii]MBM2774642.1 hypothetical protein [Burkholderia territorii]VWB37994.1 hypothetical protein BTE28158_01685 [Burkholderia territorii]